MTDPRNGHCENCRPVLDSTDGPVEHIKIACISGHVYLMPTATLARAHARMTHG